MGKIISNVWATSMDEAPQPVGIVYGRNLRTSSKPNSDEQKATGSDGQAATKSKSDHSD